MYRLVLDSDSWPCGVPFGPIVVFVLVLLRLVLSVPLCEPVLDELLEFVLLGEAAVGTRWPYCAEYNRGDKRLGIRTDDPKRHARNARKCEQLCACVV